MSIKEHKKHTDIASPSYGFYGRNEWAIVGTQCGTIKALADNILNSLAGRYTGAYADARHAEDKTGALPANVKTGAITVYTDFIRYHQFNFAKGVNQFTFKQMFNDIDMVLVNGNHFQAESQVVVIDTNKKESLKKRLLQLTNIELFLLADTDSEIFDFIKDVLPSWSQVPVYKLNEISLIAGFFKMKMELAKPVLTGLVLAGGKSERMGYDKGLIEWHGKGQQYHLADLLKNLCGEVYISCRPDQQKEIHSGYQTLPDTFIGLGPYGAILSAFREKPGVAWLVVACDLPLLDVKTLQYLKEHRNPSSIATAFENAGSNLPEPLITIWEPRSYPVLLSFLSQGYNCPRKVLLNSDISTLTAPDPKALTNVNTQEELQKMQLVLQKELPVSHAT